MGRRDQNTACVCDRVVCGCATHVHGVDEVGQDVVVLSERLLVPCVDLVVHLVVLVEHAEPLQVLHLGQRRHLIMRQTHSSEMARPLLARLFGARMEGKGEWGMSEGLGDVPPGR